METFIDYEVQPCARVPEGFPRQRLAVLSPIWRGRSLRLEYPDGTVHFLQGSSPPEPEESGEIRVFWTRHHPQAPPVCLAIGGGCGLLILAPEAGTAGGQNFPLLALAESLIPPEVLAIIGPRPEWDLLLLA